MSMGNIGRSEDGKLTLLHLCRFLKRKLSTPSSKTSRRASFVSSATASPTKVTSGTMVPSLRYISLENYLQEQSTHTYPFQTWEDPNVTHPETKAKGDNDPLDVCEIGELVAKPGEVKQVKVLGVMALLDEGETDWKIMVIDVNDPLAPKLNDIEDVERHLPGLLRASNEWFRIYKIPDGKPENQFAFSGECKNRKYAMDVVRECAEAWEKLITGKTQPGEISLKNTTVAHSSEKSSNPEELNIPKGENLQPAPIDSSIDKWFFISGASN
jgi:inorganic pyrophosphatase